MLPPWISKSNENKMHDNDNDEGTSDKALSMSERKYRSNEEEAENYQSRYERRHSSNNNTSSGNNDTDRLSVGQELTCLCAVSLALLAVGLVVYWILFTQMGGGGLSWSEGKADQVFNWHPLMMVTAFSFMTVASLIFRLGRARVFQTTRNQQTTRTSLKMIHALSWAVVAGCASVGILAVFKSHNDPVSGYKPNLYSLHSWIGTGVLLLFVTQFVVGLHLFGIRLHCVSSTFRSTMMQLHRYTGTIIYNLTAVTILMGILEKETFVGCAYDVSKNAQPDLPFQNFTQIPLVCRVGHSLGVVIALMTMCTGYVLYNFPAATTTTDDDDNSGSSSNPTLGFV